MKKLIQQKRRVFAPERNKIVMEEMEKLLALDLLEKFTTSSDLPMLSWQNSQTGSRECV